MTATATMLMFKPDCLSSEALGFPRILMDAMRIGASDPARTDWRMEFGVRSLLTRNMVEKLYAEHAGKPFYERIVRFASDGDPSFVSVWSCSGQQAWEAGRDVVSQIREAYGKSDPEVTGPANIIYGSDGPGSARREVRWALKCMELECASFREEE